MQCPSETSHPPGPRLWGQFSPLSKLPQNVTAPLWAQTTVYVFWRVDREVSPLPGSRLLQSKLDSHPSAPTVRHTVGAMLNTADPAEMQTQPLALSTTLPWNGVPPVTLLVCFLRSGELVHPNAAKQTKSDLQPPLSISCRAVSPQTFQTIISTGNNKLRGLGRWVWDFLAVRHHGLLLVPGLFLPLSFERLWQWVVTMGPGFFIWIKSQE